MPEKEEGSSVSEQPDAWPDTRLAQPENEAEVARLLANLFPWRFAENAAFKTTDDARRIAGRLKDLRAEPLTLTHLNQFLHLAGASAVTAGFFDYYFLSIPVGHPYSFDDVGEIAAILDGSYISSLSQLEWGTRRFYTDALMFFGDFQRAFDELRRKGKQELSQFFELKRFDEAAMQLRGRPLPLHDIPVDDRYLVSEIACKAYGSREGQAPLIKRELLKAYQSRGNTRVLGRDILDAAVAANSNDFQAQLALPLGSEEFLNEVVESEYHLSSSIDAVLTRFEAARRKALANTKLYLSLSRELDVYVATSMRSREDFRHVALNCKTIFEDRRLSPYCLRYFDPTLSAADCHEDKGIIECLVVRCAKVLLYFAEERETWGKDSEAAMALSLGKPVIIYCPSTPDGAKRLRIFRDVHPLSRLTDMRSGVAVGAFITDKIDIVIQLLERLFSNSMEYTVENDGHGYFRLREKLTDSVVRLCTNSAMIRSAFWNNWFASEERL